MHRVIYTSTARKLMTERDLETLLRSARKHNARQGLTGLLIYHDGCFFQILEGEEDVVKRCYRFIQLDPRHTNCIELANGPAVSRMFSQWWMSHCVFDDLSHYQRRQFVDLQQFAKEAAGRPMIDDLRVNATLLAFLSGFRDLDLPAAV